MDTPARLAMDLIENGDYITAIVILIESYGFSSTQLSVINGAIEKELTK